MAIDIGNPAINLDKTASAGYTYITLGNPANEAGVLDTVETWAVSNLSGFKVGTFVLDGSFNANDRDYATIGNVTSGSKQTFTGLSIDVEIGDYIGCYFSGGLLEYKTSTGSGDRYKNADLFGAGSTATSLNANFYLPLYATGETPSSIIPQMLVIM